MNILNRGAFGNQYAAGDSGSVIAAERCLRRRDAPPVRVVPDLAVKNRRVVIMCMMERYSLRQGLSLTMVSVSIIRR